MVLPNGLIVTGEPFWIKEPDPEYLKQAGMKKEDFSMGFSGNIFLGEENSLRCIYAIESSLDEWDNYETLQWKAVSDYVLKRPDDPDVPELEEKKMKDKANYLKWERGVLGWGIFIFRMPK
jgi:hypothetical protein